MDERPREARAAQEHRGYHAREAAVTVGQFVCVGGVLRGKGWLGGQGGFGEWVLTSACPRPTNHTSPHPSTLASILTRIYTRSSAHTYPNTPHIHTQYHLFIRLPVVEGVEELENRLVEDEDGRGGAPLRPQVVHRAVQLRPGLLGWVIGLEGARGGWG